MKYLILLILLVPICYCIDINDSWDTYSTDLYINYTKPNMSDLITYINTKSINSTVINVSGWYDGRQFICKYTTNNTYDCNWTSEIIKPFSVKIYEEAIIWHNFTEKPIAKSKDLYSFSYILYIVVKYLSWGYGVTAA